MLLTREWLFDVRAHRSQDPRFEVMTKMEDELPVEFVIVRSSTGKWLISGENLPAEIEECVNDIGKALGDEQNDLSPGTVT